MLNKRINHKELKINISELPKKKISNQEFLDTTGLGSVEEFKTSELKPYPIFQDICKFVILCYDKNGLPKYSDNAKDRRQQAIEMIFHNGDSDLEQDKRDLLEGKEKEVMMLAIGYLKLQDNMKFANLMSYEKIFWENIEELNSRSSSADEEKAAKAITLKSKIREENEILQASIESLRKQIYPPGEEGELSLFNKTKSDYGQGNILERYARAKEKKKEITV